MPGRNQAMKQQALVIHALPANLDRDRITTVRTGCLDAPVRVQGRANPKCVPGAIAVPRTAGGPHAVGGRHGRKRVGHPNFAGGRVEDKRVGPMQVAPHSYHLGAGQPRPVSHLLRRRRTAQRYKSGIGQIAHDKRLRIHIGDSLISRSASWAYATIDVELRQVYLEARDRGSCSSCAPS